MLRLSAAVFLTCVLSIACVRGQPPSDAASKSAVWPPLDSAWQDAAIAELAASNDDDRGLEQVTGSVVDIRRRVIAEAVVLLIENNHLEKKSTLLGLAKTNPQGRFLISAPTAGPKVGASRCLFAIAEKYSFAVLPLLGFDGRGSLQLTLRPSSSVELRTATVDGHLVKNASVTVQGLASVLRTRRRSSATIPVLPFDVIVNTGPDGTARIPNVPPGASVKVEVSHQDYASVQCEVRPNADESSDDFSTFSPAMFHMRNRTPLDSPLVIQFAPADHAYVMVVDDATGAVIAGVKVRRSTRGETMVTKDSGKAFFVSWPQPGIQIRERVEVIPRTDAHPRLLASVAQNAQQGTVIRLPPAKNISGSVRAHLNNQPVANATVMWVADVSDRSGLAAIAYTDQNGDFQMLVPTGQGTLIAYHSSVSAKDNLHTEVFARASRATTFPVRIDTAADLDTKYELSASCPVQRSVLVTDRNGQPIAGARIRVAGAELLSNATTDLKTDAAGTAEFTLKDINSDFILIAIKGDQGGLLDSRKLGRSGSIRMTLSTMSTISGRMLVEGSPRQGMTVEIRPVNARRSMPFARHSHRYFYGRTDAYGFYRARVPAEVETDFVVEPVPGGVRAKQPTVVSVQPDSETNAGDTNLFITQGNRSINGKVVDSDGNPIRCQVYAYRDMPDREKLTGLLCAPASSDDKGNFKLTDCPMTNLVLLFRVGQASKIVNVNESQTFIQVKFGK